MVIIQQPIMSELWWTEHEEICKLISGLCVLQMLWGWGHIMIRQSTILTVS